MTLKTIAALTGTTVSSVSKAFRDSKEISKETKEKIYDTAKKLGCFDKYYRGKGTKRVIGIILPEPESETYGIAVGKIENALRERGAEVLIGISRFSKDRARDLYSYMIHRAGVDGIVLFGEINGLKKAEYVPTVIISETEHEGFVGTDIVINLKEAMNDLVSLLKKRGYRRIGFIGEGLTSSRLNAFKHSMRTNGLPLHEDMIFVAKHSRFAEAGMDGMKAFIDSGVIPEVIITAYDNIAFGAMKVAKENGYSIPDDIAFVGINDIDTSEYVSTSLTSIDTSYEEVAASAADILLKRIDNKENKRLPKSLNIPARIKVRESMKTGKM